MTTIEDMDRVTAAQLTPSPPRNVATAAAFGDDEIRELGERIARLTPEQHERLSRYLWDRLEAEHANDD